MPERLFDTREQITIKVATATGPKPVEVRFPTDAEWIDYKRRKKILQQDLGRRNYQFLPARPEKADAELYGAILATKNGAVDQAEGLHVLSRLAFCDALQQPEAEGGGYRIVLKILGGLRTEHLLRCPSVAEQMDYERRSSNVTFQQFGMQSITVNLAPMGDLYDKLKLESKGYAGDVPIIHKAEALNVLLQEVKASLTDDEDPEQ